MSEADSAVNVVDVFRQRASQAEAEAEKAADGLAREVFTLVAVTWREIALDAARVQKARRRTN